MRLGEPEVRERRQGVEELSLIHIFHGAAGVSQFFPLANMYAHQRTLRIADGPDEVHKMTIARREILKHQPGFRMNPSAGS